MAVVAGLSEAGGGTLLALGFATPLAGAMLATVMIKAIGSVTFKRGFMLGSELEIAYLTIAVSLAAVGPGRFSIDRAIGWDDNISGVWWGVAAARASLVISFLTLTLGRTRPVGEQGPAAQTYMRAGVPSLRTAILRRLVPYEKNPAASELPSDYLLFESY
jgi:putative oxidoreductase